MFLRAIISGAWGGGARWGRGERENSGAGLGLYPRRAASPELGSRRLAALTHPSAMIDSRRTQDKNRHELKEHITVPTSVFPIWSWAITWGDSVSQGKHVTHRKEGTWRESVWACVGGDWRDTENRGDSLLSSMNPRKLKMTRIWIKLPSEVGKRQEKSRHDWLSKRSNKNCISYGGEHGKMKTVNLLRGEGRIVDDFLKVCDFNK